MISSKSYLLSMASMLVALILVGFISLRPEPVVVRTNLENLPLQIGGWTGSEDAFPESIYRVLDADRHVYRHYRSRDGLLVDLYIGYYGTAKGGRTGHNPYACLPSSGWAIVESRTVPLRQAGSGSEVDVNFIKARRNGVNTLMVHWYQSAGTRVMSRGLEQNLERLKGRLFDNRNDGAYVQVSARTDDDQVAEREARVEDFALRVLEILPGYWPVEE